MKKQSGIGFNYKNNILIYLEGNLFFIINNLSKTKPIQPDYKLIKVTNNKITLKMEIE